MQEQDATDQPQLNSRSESVEPLRILRPARRVGGWSDLGIVRQRSERGAAAALDELREDRV